MKHIARSTVLRLAATYLAIIMVMSIGFSVIFYSTSAHQLDRRPNPNPTNNAPVTVVLTGDVENFLDQRASEGKAELVGQLILINFVVLVAGGMLSYLLAIKTLQPIEENMEAQAQFVSDASHELRTPLTALRVNNEVALRDKKLTLSQAKSVIGETVEDTARLQQLSNALLDLLKDGDQQLSQEVSLRDVVADAINTVVPQAMDKKMSIDDQVADLTVHGNPSQLAQVLVILLDNAIKYSDRGKTVHIAVAAHGRDAHMTVRDEGIGIADDELDHIFTRFYRSDKSRSRQHGSADGYGLGLAIAEKLIQAHRGTISVESVVDKGSTFTITLPLVK